MIKDNLPNKEIGEWFDHHRCFRNGDWNLCELPKLLFRKGGCVMSWFFVTHPLLVAQHLLLGPSSSRV